jgi:thioredoxin-like negative regulator of GroEL
MTTNLTRRILLTLATAGALGAAPFAHALEIKPFTQEALAAAQAAGQPVAVHFHADWCGTCKQQEKVLAQLKTEPGLNLTLLVADYDKEKDLRRALKVRSQSTMVVFRGKEEKARLGGDTDPAKFRAAFKAAL